jgi:EEF1A lysine methyltransferase 2
MITDKGTLDAIGLSSGCVQKRSRYRLAVWDLLSPGGLLVITSCNSTKDELVTEFCDVPEQLSRLSNPLADCKEAAQQVPPSQTANSRPACGEEDAADEEAAAHESGSQEEGLLGGLEEQQGVVDQGRRFWEYVDHVRTYQVFRFGGVEGTRVATVAFRRVG